MAVFVLDQRKRPVMPCSEKRARLLLERGRAVVHRRIPFTIRLRDRKQGDCMLQPLALTLDPGSKTTGIALSRQATTVVSNETVIHRHAVALMELSHRGHSISESLTQRRAFRRRRRNQLRYRPARFNNRTKPQGWLAPSLRHRVETTMAWVHRLCRLAPVTALGQELVKFDMQLMQNPEISGVAYQQGTLAGYEAREYLLEKWHRTCAYCGDKNVPLEIEHIQPRSLGGSDRISNLTLACHPCNQRKGNKPIEVFLNDKPAILKKIQAQAKAPLKDASAVNSTRWALFQALQSTGLPVETASGGVTKWNRTRLHVPKTHALDALCVGKVDQVSGWIQPSLAIKPTGRGIYQRTRLDRFGFPRGTLMRSKSAFGFQTGDHVKAMVPTGKKTGTYVGKVAIRATGSFNITTSQGVVQGVSHRHCHLLQRADGYSYTNVATLRRREQVSHTS